MTTLKEMIMANDLNLCQFIGRLGKDVELKFLPNNDPVCNFSLACGWKARDKEGTEWMSIVVFGKLAEICSQYLKKGSLVYVSGKMRTEKYTKDNVEKYSVKIIADKMQMLGGKNEENIKTSGTDWTNEMPKPTPVSFNDIEDDIPF
jgi:single-strand DNA-binding protein